MKQIHLFKKDFVIFLKGATFSDFIETKLWNYKPLAIRIRFPLLWRIFFSIRFKPHQVVSSYCNFNVFMARLYLLKIPICFNLKTKRFLCFQSLNCKDAEVIYYDCFCNNAYSKVYTVVQNKPDSINHAKVSCCEIYFKKFFYTFLEPCVSKVL